MKQQLNVYTPDGIVVITGAFDASLNDGILVVREEDGATYFFKAWLRAIMGEPESKEET